MSLKNSNGFDFLMSSVSNHNAWIRKPINCQGKFRYFFFFRQNLLKCARQTFQMRNVKNYVVCHFKISSVHLRTKKIMSVIRQIGLDILHSKNHAWIISLGYKTESTSVHFSTI